MHYLACSPTQKIIHLKRCIIIPIKIYLHSLWYQKGVERPFAERGGVEPSQGGAVSCVK